MPEIPSFVFPRRLDKRLPQAVKTKGIWIEDVEGNRYLDGSGGPLVVNIGHGREEIARAMYHQALQCDYAHPTMFTSPPVENLARSLGLHAPKGITRFYFLTSGAEAVEAAIKLARQIHLANSRPQKIRLIARAKSYHGLTLGALAATGRTTFRAPFAPLLTEVLHIPPPYCLRCSYGLTLPGCQLRCAYALEEIIQDAGPETVSAFLAETISGATIAAVPPPPGYFTVIREICDRYDVLLILDEILCGLGRTGHWYACEHYHVTPDIVTNGKGLGGGAVAISAVGVQGRHFDAILHGSGQFVHGGTFSHHSVAAAAAVEVIRILEEEHLVKRVEQKGKILGGKLKLRLAGHPHVADIRGLGFLWGVEFVKDVKTLEAFPRREKFIERLWANIFKQGVALYCATGLAGIDGDALVIGPPFVIEEAQMDHIIDAIEEGLRATLA